MASREEILADFQACTGIEDVEVAICQLEEANWLLTEAVNNALSSTSSPPTLQAATSSKTSRTSFPSTTGSYAPPRVVVAASTKFEKSVSDDDDDDDMSVAGPSSEMGRIIRMLNFNVHHNDRVIQLSVPDNEDVQALKTLLYSETGFPPCQQELTGFRSSGMPLSFVSNHRRLSNLNLPKENDLYLNTPTIVDPPPPDPLEEKDFQLTVTYEESGEKKKIFNLNFRPTQNVRGVKLDVSSLTKLPVSKQIWTGWPKDVNDDLSLAQIGIPREHSLTLSSDHRDMPVIDLDAVTPPPPVVKPLRRDDDSNDDDGDEFEDAASNEMIIDDDDDDDDDDVIYAGRDNSGGQRPLLPDNYGDDEAMAAIKFAEEFTSRYGTPHPTFFPGSLDDAIKESCLQPAKDRKMLAVYLHHDSSVFTNVFCAHVLCADTVISFLNENFVVFGWDLTHNANKQRAVSMISRHLGSVAAASVKNFDTERLPLIALIYRLRGTTEIFQIIHGNVTLDELLSRLLSAHETYHSQLVVEIKQEDERAARDAVKREQDLAFEMSLVADREKEAVRRREESDKVEKERIDAAMRRSQEEELARKEREKESLRKHLKTLLPPEPPNDKTDCVSHLRFRVPVRMQDDDDDDDDDNNTVAFADNNGKRQLERRFLASTKLETVFNYLTTEGYPCSEFKVLSSWPRRDLTQLEPCKTLKDLKLYPQETLTLEEK